MQNIQILFWRAPPLRGGFLRDLAAALRRQLVAPCRAALPAERLGALVLPRIVRVLLDLASENPGGLDRGGYSIGGSFLAFWSLWHVTLELLNGKHI